MAESRRRYLGQMDLNIKSPLVWEFYEETLKKLADYGAGIVRLDAFAYAPKKPGEKNFLNDRERGNFWRKSENLQINLDWNFYRRFMQAMQMVFMKRLQRKDT